MSFIYKNELALVAAARGVLVVVVFLSLCGCGQARINRDPRVVAWAGYLNTMVKLNIMERDGVSIEFDNKVILENKMFFNDLIELRELVAVSYDPHPNSLSTELVYEFTAPFTLFGDSVPSFVGGNTLLGAQNPPGVIYIKPSDLSRLPHYLRIQASEVDRQPSLDHPAP